MPKEPPIALEAYEKLAESFSARAESKAENAYIEQPSIRSLIGRVQGLQILDAGCGPGILTRYLLDQGAASVTAFDISPQMIAYAQKRVRGEALLHVADLSEPLSFAQSQTYDLVVSSLAMDYVKDWNQPFREFKRVLRPGGRLLFSVQHPISAHQWYNPPSYFGVQRVEAWWKGFTAEPVLVPDYFRPFDEMIKPILANGFSLTRLEECKPVAALKNIDPARFERFANSPSFLVFEAKSGSLLNQDF